MLVVRTAATILLCPLLLVLKAILPAAVGCRGVAPVPLGPAGTDGNFQAAAGQPTGDAWLAMALSSGWTQDMPKKKALEQAFGSVLVF